MAEILPKWLKLNSINQSDVILSMTYCHCIYNYGMCCNCIDTVASMFIRKDAHKVVAQLRVTHMVHTDHRAGYKRIFEVLMNKHEKGGGLMSL